jgi:hypothetical protein
MNEVAVGYLCGKSRFINDEHPEAFSGQEQRG